MQSGYSGRRTWDESRSRGSYHSSHRRSARPPPALGSPAMASAAAVAPGSPRRAYSPSIPPPSPVKTSPSHSLSPRPRSNRTPVVQPYKDAAPSEEDRANKMWRAWRPEDNVPPPTVPLRSTTFQPPPAEHTPVAIVRPKSPRAPVASTSTSSSVGAASSQRKEPVDPSNIWDDDTDEDWEGIGGGGPPPKAPAPAADLRNSKATATVMITEQQAQTTTATTTTTTTTSKRCRNSSSDKFEFYLVNSNARMITIEDIGARRIASEQVSSPPPPQQQRQYHQHQQSGKSAPPPPSSKRPEAAFPSVNDSPFMYPRFLAKPSSDHYHQYQDFDMYEQQTTTTTTHKNNNNNNNNSTGGGGGKGHYVHPDDILYPHQKRPYFSPFMSPEDMELGIAEGKLHRGVIRINRRNRYDAYVTTEQLDSDIYIGGEKDRNRALEGDVVAVRLLNVDDVWKKRKERSQRQFARRDASVENIGNEDEEEELDYELSDEEDQDYKPKYAGQIVGIIDKPTERLCAGFLVIEKMGDDKNVDVVDPNTGAETPRAYKLWFRPLDKRMPLMSISRRDAPPDVFEKEDYYKARLLVAKKLKWPIVAQRPYGKIIRMLGEVGDLKTETQAILANCGISEEPFSPAALKVLPPLPWSIPAQELANRRDLRMARSFSIDPETARDLDDVLHIRRLNDGEFFEVGVHIADVSYFVKANSSLDSEARERGTSAYLVDKVVPMLPKELSENLCSLHPGEPKLAFSVIWKMDPDANILNTWIGKTVIQSCAQLSYTDAQTVIDGHSLPSSVEIKGHEASEVEKDILDLMALAQKLRTRRYDKGALALQSVKLTFELDDQGEPTSVSSFEAKDANRLVEEFMLRANISAAQKIVSQYPQESLLRRHKGPINRRLEQFLEHAKELGFKLNGKTAGELQASFRDIEEGGIKDVLLALAIKPMQRADYFCAGAVDINRHKHYALNEPIYTHFTSPIRRYADIIVHRQLEAAINKKGACGMSKKIVQKVAFQCNFMKERARSAQDLSIHLYLARYLSESEKKQGPVVRTGIIMAVHPHAVDVYVSEYGLERRVYLEDLPLDGFDYEDNYRTIVLQWQRGVLVDMQSQFERLYRNSKGPHVRHHHQQQQQQRQQVQTDIEGGEDSDSSQDESAASKTVPQIPSQMLAPSPLDQDKCTQKLRVFATLDVRLQVNNQRSPPFINVYPMNPFP